MNELTKEEFKKYADKGVHLFGAYTISKGLKSRAPKDVNTNEYWELEQSDYEEMMEYAKIILPVVLQQYLKSIDYDGVADIKRPHSVMYDVFELASAMWSARQDELDEYDNKRKAVA
jgi:hypothetical protein